MSETEKKQDKPFFSADVEMTRISKFNVRFRVLNHEGATLPLHHLEFARSDFPIDDDFNMNFINADLRKLVDDIGNKVEVPKDIFAKQKAFRKFRKFRIMIF